MPTWSGPIKLHPKHYTMIRLMFAGRTEDEIATELSCSYQQVHQVLIGDAAREVINRVYSGVLDLVPELAQQAMMAAPAMLEQKIWLAMNSGDHRVRSTCTSDVMGLVGLAPIKRVSVTVEDHDLRDLDGMTADQIRAKVLEGLGLSAAIPTVAVGSDGGTVH